MPHVSWIVGSTGRCQIYVGPPQRDYVPMSERKYPPIQGNIVTYFPGTYGSGVPTGIGGSFRSEA